MLTVDATAPCTAVLLTAPGEFISPAENCDQISGRVLPVITVALAPPVIGACSAKLPTCSLSALALGPGGFPKDDDVQKEQGLVFSTAPVLCQQHGFPVLLQTQHFSVRKSSLYEFSM